MDSDEIAVASPASAALSSPSPSDDPLQNSGPAPAPRRNPQIPPYQLPEAYEPPSGNNEELQNDLNDFGFRADQINGLMSKRESFFDATMQRPQFQTREDRENERKGLGMGLVGARRGVFRAMPGTMGTPIREAQAQRVGKRVKVKGEKAEGLVVEGNGTWVLFDPQAHDYPRRFIEDVPALFRRYERYEPGNKRIVEYNLKTFSVRLKSTPDALGGKKVEYTKTGPKLIEDEVVLPPKTKRVPGRPRKRGGRGGGTVGRTKQNLDAGVSTRTTGVLKPVKKPVVKIEPESDNDSESPLTDLETELEIKDSQDKGEGWS